MYIYIAVKVAEIDCFLSIILETKLSVIASLNFVHTVVLRGKLSSVFNVTGI